MSGDPVIGIWSDGRQFVCRLNELGIAVVERPEREVSAIEKPGGDAEPSNLSQGENRCDRTPQSYHEQPRKR